MPAGEPSSLLHNPKHRVLTYCIITGSLAGALLNSYLADKFGRRMCVILSGWIWVIGCIIMAVAPNVACLVAGRVIGGFGVGIASAIVTVYQVRSKSCLPGPSCRKIAD